MRHGLKLFFCGLFLALVTLVPSAFGDSYTYTTSGNFASSGTATTLFMDSFTTGQVDASLVFSGIASPVTALGGATTSLGSFAFSVLNNPLNISFPASDLFSMLVSFSAPPTTGGFLALVTGNVFFDHGGAVITFFPTIQQLTAADGSIFTLSLNANPVFVGSGQTPVNVYATITAVPVPEACTLLLLGISGLMLVGMTKMRTAAIG